MSFLNSISSLTTALSTWFIRFRNFLPEPKEVPSDPYDPLFSIIYCYPNVFFTGSYYGCLILLNGMANTLRPDEALMRENEVFINDVCKTVDFSSFGVFWLLTAPCFR
jgi:hypothetical protein